jgi:hypothetical protein
VDSWAGERSAEAGEVKRLGDQATVVRLRSAEATVDVAARVEDRDLIVGPNRWTADGLERESAG